MVSKASAFKSAHNEPTVRLTVAQAIVRFLANQYVERDGERSKFFAGCFGIFGHGNVAGMGQALLQAEIEAEQAGTEPGLRYVLGRNEQAMVHTAAAYARQKDRLQAWAVTASIGPGSTNMLTGAALATINRLPVLLLPSDTFATRVSAPVLQDLEQPHDNEMTVTDAFKPLSRFFDRVWRPEQLPSALIGAMRVLTDPVETGAATIALPQDVQAEAFDWPESLFAERTWHIARPLPERSMVAQAAEIIASAQRPLDRRGRRRHLLRRQRRVEGLRRADRHPGLGDAGGQGLTPLRPPAVGRRPSVRPEAPPPTRWPPTPTSSSESAPATAISPAHRGPRSTTRTSDSSTSTSPRFDAVKQGGLSVVADAREAIDALTDALSGLLGQRRIPHSDSRTGARVGRHRHRGVPRRGRRQRAEPEPGHRAGEHAVRSPRRGRVRGRLHARRPAQAVAHPRPQGLSRRIRLLLHGIRGRRRHRRPDGQPGPRRVRHGRRRLLPDDGHRIGDRGAGRRQGHPGAGAEPRLRLDRLAVGVVGVAAIRHRLPLPRRARADWRATSFPSTWRPTRPASAPR